MKVVLEWEVNEKIFAVNEDVSRMSDKEIKELITQDPYPLLVNADWTIFRH